MIEKYKLQYPVRIVTATSLFDGHDAAINIMRRMLQATGAEVIHLGHNRSVSEVVSAAIQEDAQAIAVSSYQGGHLEYFKYMVDSLRAAGRDDILIFGGGGGVIIPEEIRELEAYGVARLYSPYDGQTLGLQGIINDILQRSDHSPIRQLPESLVNLTQQEYKNLARLLSGLENNALSAAVINNIREVANKKNCPVIGITGTGGAGKSSLIDELLSRFRSDNSAVSIALLAIDPTRRKTGGALLGDRIRMNALANSNIYFRSVATRNAAEEVIAALPDMIALCQCADFDVIFVETPGIGQGASAIVPLVDLSLYVMTPEFGAATQLEKIDMLDYADIVAVNKCDRPRALDTIRDVSKQMQRNKEEFHKKPEEMPVYGTVAAHFNDLGVTALYAGLINLLNNTGKGSWSTKLVIPFEKISSYRTALVPSDRQHYLAEIAKAVRRYHAMVDEQSQLVRERQHLQSAVSITKQDLSEFIETREVKITAATKQLLDSWYDLRERYKKEEFVVHIRDKEIRTKTHYISLSGTAIPRVSLPQYYDEGDRLTWLMLENVPGEFPYTAGVFHFKRDDEDPSRMFAGEGDPFCTNRRFKLLSKDAKATRLSTAFDSVTLYGFEPHEQPDIYGKVGNSGVSIATLDDMRVLYDGFDLCAPTTSVSMTINGPAPTILAMFLNTVIDQQVDYFKQREGKEPNQQEYQALSEHALQQVRGTVQADILKEDQGQNTCIFSTEFSLKLMGDIQEYFIAKKIANFYSVSISGYHIAEAGANPISQLAFTLANGFTFVEYYLSRGMHIDNFALNLSFFFSNGMDPEYSVMGRVARRIWAIAMRDRYGANSRSQKLKYHLQTSGRSLHAQEIDFNDIRTTLEALMATYDNCNSLHTNAYDEAVTTPTEASVRRALAIQLIINREYGVARNENPLQGSFIMEELTALVEEAVLLEFERLSERGGVLGAMETGYQRSKIQEQSLYYEAKKHDGSLPLVGVNMFVNPNPLPEKTTILLQRSSDAEKQNQLKRLRSFQTQHAVAVPAMLEKLKATARQNGNIFSVLMEAVRVCSLGQITKALFEVGGQYRRNM